MVVPDLQATEGSINFISSGTKSDRMAFKRCRDGWAVFDSPLLTSGYVTTPINAQAYVPVCINGDPVTELHQKVLLGDGDKYIAIEGRNLRRVYLDVVAKSLNDELDEIEDPDIRLIHQIFAALEGRSEKGPEALNFHVAVYNHSGSADLLSVRSETRCVLDTTPVRELQVNAPAVTLRGQMGSVLEVARFSGRVYPGSYYDWGDGVQGIDCFAGCGNLKVLEGSFAGEEGWVFRDCASLQKVHLANGMKTIPPYAFQNCSSLKDLYVPDSVTSIGDFAFAGCTELQSIHLPDGIKRVSKGMFKGCSSLRKVYLSDNIEEIDDEAFAGCTSIKKPWIPKNIKRISQSAFDNPEWGKT